jgi:hypothetical protein
MFMFSLCKQKKAKVKVRMPGRRYKKAIDLACLCPVSSCRTQESFSLFCWSLFSSVVDPDSEKKTFRIREASDRK